MRIVKRAQTQQNSTQQQNLMINMRQFVRLLPLRGTSNTIIGGRTINRSFSTSTFNNSIPRARTTLITTTTKLMNNNNNNNNNITFSHLYNKSQQHQLNPLLSTFVSRSLFLQTVDTPNPASVKFLPGVPVMEPEKTGGMTTANFSSPLEAYKSPLAKALFKVDGVRGVFLGSNFITVTIDLDHYDWSDLNVFIFNAISNFYETGRPVLQPDAQQNMDTALAEDDDEVIVAIKEILETKVRPMVQEDGGDVCLIKFEDGIVYLQLQGSCTSCPSSTITLKHGIENMLMYYVPEVEEVRQWESEADQASEEQLKKVEAKTQGAAQQQ